MVETVKKNYGNKNRIIVRYSDEQQDKIRAACKKHECSISDWLRHVLDKAKV